MDIAAITSTAVLLWRELQEDDIEMWWLVSRVRRRFAGLSDPEVRSTSTALALGLVDAGCLMGDMDAQTGRVRAWDGDVGLEIARRWDALGGREPNMGDIGWLSMPD